LEHFAYWGFSFLLSGPPPKKRGDPTVVLVIAVAGFVGQNSGLSCFEKNVVMGALWASII
jgi:hypothetical protein